MANRPDIDTGQLQKANQLMSDIVSKFDSMIRFRNIPSLSLLPKELEKVDKKMKALNTAADVFLSKNGKKKWKEYTDAVKGNREEIERLQKRMKTLQEFHGKSDDQLDKENEKYHLAKIRIRELDDEFKELSNTEKAVGKLAMSEGMSFLDWFGGSVTSLGFSTVLAGLKLITASITKVYDLQEKWANAIGNFRNQIGPATKDTTAFELTARKLHFPLEDLGMDFDAAHTEMANFIKGFGFADLAANKWSETAVKMGIITGAGTESIAALSRNLKLMGVEQNKQAHYFSDIIGVANGAGVGVADFTKEIANSTESLAEFGATGQKMFLGAAGWAMKLGVSIKSLQNIIKLTDTFESTATAAAKMNTIFGTSINSMDLMLEQDPAKRFNMIRDSLIGVGKDMQHLSRLEKKSLSDTLGLSIEETNAFLNSKKNYNEYMNDKAKAEEKSARQAADMNKYMLLASKTLYNWSALAERVITKLEPIFNAFLKGLGVGFDNASMGSKTFVEKFEHVVDKIMDTLTKNGILDEITHMATQFRKIGEEIFKDNNIETIVASLSKLFINFGRFTSWILAISASPAIKLLSWIFEKLGTWGHVIAGAWAGAKAGAAVGTLFGAIGAVPGAIAGAIIGGGGAAIAGSFATSEDRKERIKKKMDEGKTRAQAEREADAEQPDAAPDFGDNNIGNEFDVTTGSDHDRGPSLEHTHNPLIIKRRPDTRTDGGSGTYHSPSNGHMVVAPISTTLHVHLDSREIQRIPFNTTVPINVSVAGT